MSPALTPAQPAPQEHGGGDAAPAEPGRPSRATLPASGRAQAAPRRSRGRLRPPPRATARKLWAPPRGCPRGLTKPTRSGGGAQAAPSSAPLRPPSRVQSLGNRGLPPTPRHPLARRYLVGAPPPGPRPAPCAAAATALFWRRFNSRPREKLSYPGTPRPARAPGPGEGTGLARPLPEGPLCAPSAHPPSGRPRQGPRGSRARPPRARRPLPPSRPGPAVPSGGPRASEGAARCGCHTPGRPTARDPPRPRRRRRHAAPGQSAPGRSAPPARPGPHTTGFPPSPEGRADSPGGVAATIFAWPAAGACSRLPARLRFTTTGGPRPGVRPAGPPREESFAEGREPRRRCGGRPHPLGLARGREVARRRRSGGGGGTSKDHVGE